MAKATAEHIKEKLRAWGPRKLDEFYWRAKAARCAMLPRLIARCGECHALLPPRWRFGKLKSLLRLADHIAPYKLCDRCPIRPGCPLDGNRPGFLVWLPWKPYPYHTDFLDELAATNGDVCTPIVGSINMRQVRLGLKAAHDVWSMNEIYGIVCWPGPKDRYALALTVLDRIECVVADNYTPKRVAAVTRRWVTPVLVESTGKLEPVRERAPYCRKCQHRHWPEMPCAPLSYIQRTKHMRRELLKQVDKDSGYMGERDWLAHIEREKKDAARKRTWRFFHKKA